MKSTEHIQGITVMESMNDLDAALLAEAEVAPEYLSSPGKKSARRVRRSAREGNKFLAFLNSGWGAVAVSLAVAFVLLSAVIYIGNRAPGSGFSDTGSDDTNSEWSPPISNDSTTNAAEVLLPGTTPFAPQPAKFTISTDLMIPEGTTSFTATATARMEGEGLSLCHSWSVECLTDPDWAGMTITTDDAIEVLPIEGIRAPCDKEITVKPGLVPGIYRLHAMKHNGSEYQSVAYCEFAVDDGTGSYKIWTEADFADASRGDAIYTISTQEKIPYGTKDIRVTFRSVSPAYNLEGPANCYLVKLNGTEGAGAGAGFRIKPQMQFGVDVDWVDGEARIVTISETYSIINPAAATPGRYRIYNVDDNGCIFATCEFEIVGSPLSWPGAAVEQSSSSNYTIRTKESVYPTRIDSIDIIATGDNPGEIIPFNGDLIVECLSDPDAVIPCATPSIYQEPWQPDPDEYCSWHQTIVFTNGYLPEGTYRVYHQTRDEDTNESTVTAYCDFSVNDEAFLFGSTVGNPTSTGNYTIRTDKINYPESTDKITVMARGKNPGEIIPPYEGWLIECLSDPTHTVLYRYTEEAIEMTPPAPDEYSHWKKTLYIEEGGLPTGTYRVHHREYDPKAGCYETVASYDFTVGVAEDDTRDSVTEVISGEAS